MEAQIDIRFEELVQIAKKLSVKQWTKLKQEVEEKELQNNKVFDMETFLLNGPTFTKKQLDNIAKTRKAINQWRTKPL